MTSLSRPALLSALAIGFALLGLPRTGAAGVEEARDYSRRAQKLYQQEEYEKAASLLLKAYREEPNLTYQYNRIRALEGAEQYTKALEVLKKYEEAMLEADGYDELPELKKSLRARAEKKKRGKETSPRETGERKQWREQKAAASSSADEGGSGSSARQRDAGTGSKRTLGWSLLGAGGASLAAGTLFATGLLLPGSTQGSTYSGSASTLKTHKIAAGTLLGLGAAAAAAGTYFAFVAPDGASTSPNEKAVSFYPRIGPSSAGAGIRLRFR
ncbi:MAG: hypothetical protein ABEL76_08385 [Bradymonadaceae bacterium]